VALDDILTSRKPFGPTDQARIEELRDAIALLEISEPLASACSGNHTLIYGRKGCGKSSVITIFEGYSQARARLERSHVHVEDVFPNNIAVKIDTWTRFLDISTHVHRQLVDMFGAQDARSVDYDLIPPEVVENVWIDQIWEQIFMKLRDLAMDDPKLAAQLPNVMLCFDDHRMARMRGSPDYVASTIFSSAKTDVLNLLHDTKTSVVVLFDSMDKYPINNDTFSLSMSGFLRAINTLNIKHKRLRVVFSLPEEMLPHFRAKSSNILKDFEAAYAMRWTPRELLRIAAHRYSLFLKLNEREYYGAHIAALDFSKGSHIQQFYSSLLPDSVTNELGVAESTSAYIVRHTHLLPRHLLMALNQMAYLSHKETGSWRTFSTNAIVEGIIPTLIMSDRRLPNRGERWT
jgi:hypothetical protein